MSDIGVKNSRENRRFSNFECRTDFDKNRIHETMSAVFIRVKKRMLNR